MFSIRKIAVVIAVAILLTLVTVIWIQPKPAIAFLSDDQTSPPRDGFVLRDPFVSEPVLPADTTGLPPAPAVEPRDLSKEPIRVIPNALPHPKIEGRTDGSVTIDPSVQLQPGGVNMPSPIMNFEGLNNTTGVLPPDTDGQVGPNHYVQVVNATVVGIYNKSTGALLYPTFLLSSLWPGADPCGQADNGDPIVLYDQMADRWLLTQFRVPDPYYECIAISKGSTPTNNPNDWYLYSFLVHATKMNDYPKLGVWPDGYYMSANQFSPSWAGTGVWVFDRTAMLTGAATTFQYFDLAPVDINYWALLPSNLMGSTLPPSGAPNYFVSVDQDWSGSNDIMHIFEFDTDWVTPANTTFSLVADRVVDPFDYDLCIATRERCIDQPDSAPKLEALSYRVMMHLWYRNFGTHESLVVNHTVDADGAGRAGIRWYEIRGGTVNTTLADASIYQQGTYAPADGLHRWMGSIAMDQDGNIALGYSVSSTSVYPSIRYAGRRVSDPLDTLPQAEVEIKAGTGVQTHSAARWGDYSAMSVDPVDDCTFWYTQEYIQTTGSAPWQTRIGSFKFPSCGAVAPVIDVNPVSLSRDQFPNTVRVGQLDISNVGTAALNWTIEEELVRPVDERSSGARVAPEQVGSSPPVYVPDPNAVLISEGFESGTMPPSGWSLEDSNPNETWEIGTFNPHSGSFYADILYDPAMIPQDEWLLSPELSLTAGTLSLWSFGSPYWCRDTFDNCDLNVWLVVGPVGSGDDIFVGKTDGDWIGTFTWSQSVFNLTPLLPGGPVRIGFQYIGLDGAEIALDDITLDGTSYVACSSPSDIPWLSVDPTSGTTGPGGSTDVDVTFDSTGMGAGTYNGNLCIDSNDSLEPQVVVPVTMVIPGPTFTDVPYSYWAFLWIEALYDAGITGGCSVTPLMYCPDASVNRAQMSVFLERGMRGSGYSPPLASGTVFNDVPASHWAAAWIEQLAADGITGGCSASPPLYCPASSVTRAQMAIFLERAMRWPTPFTPPLASGTVFNDVPASHWAAAWIEQLAADGITGGCSTSPPLYCPENPVTRAQMAVFLVRSFNLPIP